MTDIFGYSWEDIQRGGRLGRSIQPTAEDDRDEFRAYMRGFGAWDEAEIAAWTDEELTALLIQIISGDIRESGLLDGKTWPEYLSDAEAGRVSGSLYRGDTGGVFYHIGS